MLHLSEYYAQIEPEEENVGCVQESQIPIHFPEEETPAQRYRLLSLFSGCGGMDIGFEGGFIAPRKSFASNSSFIDHANGFTFVRIVSLRFSPMTFYLKLKLDGQHS